MSHAVYLMFNGNCEEAINFYKDNLGGNLISIQRFGETPESSSESYKDKIMHAVMDLQGLKIMFSDAQEQRNVTFGDNFSISL